MQLPTPQAEPLPMDEALPLDDSFKGDPLSQLQSMVESKLANMPRKTPGKVPESFVSHPKSRAALAAPGMDPGMDPGMSPDMAPGMAPDMEPSLGVASDEDIESGLTDLGLLTSGAPMGPDVIVLLQEQLDMIAPGLYDLSNVDTLTEVLDDIGTRGSIFGELSAAAGADGAPAGGLPPGLPGGSGISPDPGAGGAGGGAPISGLPGGPLL